MNEAFGLRSILQAPRTAYGRIRMLTPSSVWEGIGLGLVAIVAGAAAMLFHGVTAWIETNTLGRLIHLGRAWFIGGSFGTVLGGSFLASWIIARFAPNVAGGGVMPVKLAYWRDFGVMHIRTAVVKLIASALTLGSGVSMGPEGPSIQIGAATMSAAAGAAGVAKQSRRAWCAAGAAAGLAAVFNAPLAAIAFIMEEVIGDLHSKLFGRIVVAAVVGALVAHAVLGPHPAFQAAPLGVITWRPWALVPVVGLLAALGGAWFQKGSLLIRKRLGAGRPGRFAAYRPVLGAFVSWAAAILVWLVTDRTGVFGIGYHDVTAAIAGQLSLTAFFLLFVGKTVATTAAVGTSGCGGIFAPALFIGAMAGGTVAAAFGRFINLGADGASMLVMVGMAASLGAVIRTPMTCILLIYEVTGQWVVIPAILLATVVSLAVAKSVNTHDMYEEMLEQDGMDPNQVLPPRHFKRWREIPVSALATFKPVVIPSLAPAAVREVLAAGRYQRYPVVDAGGAIRGVLTRHDAELALSAGQEPPIEGAQWISGKATVGEARRKMLAGAADYLLVGDADENRLEGILTLHDILRGESVLEEDPAA
ncbi:MAG: chloride channel protein [Opitutaceae bacterium]